MSILTDFMTDIADTIREKKQTTDPIPAQSFKQEIRNLNTVEIAEGSLGSVYLAENASIRHDVSEIKEIAEDEPGLQPEAVWTLPTGKYCEMTVDSDGSTYCYIGDDHTLRKISPDGVQIWSVTCSSSNNIRLDPLGNIWCTRDFGIIAKFNQDGEEVSHFGDGKEWAGYMMIDVDGNIYATRSGSGYYYGVYKYKQDGAKIWSYREADNIDSIDVARDGNVYYGTCEYDLVGLNPSGKKVFSYVYGGAYGKHRIFSISANRAGDVYCAHSGYVIVKINNNNGSEKWGYYDEGIGDILAGNKNSVYTCGSNKLMKINSRSEKVWETDLDIINRFGIDAEENLYCACSDGTLRKLKNTTQLKKAVYCE